MSTLNPQEGNTPSFARQKKQYPLPALGRGNSKSRVSDKTLIFYVEKTPGKVSEENVGFGGDGRKAALVILSLADSRGDNSFHFSS